MDWTKPGDIDLCGDRRTDDDWVAAQWVKPRARALCVDGRGRIAWAKGRLLFQQVTELAIPYDPKSCYFLGLVAADASSTGVSGEDLLTDGWSTVEISADELADGALTTNLSAAIPVFATTVENAGVTAAASESLSMKSLRGQLDVLADDEVMLAFTAVALARWHASAGYCPTCGSPTQPAQGGHIRYCLKCASELFPRTDSAVIVAVRDQTDRLLFGRKPSWEPRRMSMFAGFVEAGESLEQAVCREVAEEVGLQVAELRYIYSQPWPFPRSLMLAFSARTSDPAFTVDGYEIEAAQWLTRDEYRTGIGTGAIMAPSQHTVARRLIQDWLDNPE